MTDKTDKTNQKLAIFVLSQKGGVGKTTWCRGYLDRAREAGKVVAAYDADGQVGQLVQYYGSKVQGSVGLKASDDQDPLVGVAYFDVRSEKQRDLLVTARNSEAEVVLMDLPGGSVQELVKVLGDGESLFDAYREVGYRPVVVIVINHMIASVRTVREAITMFGPDVDYIVVKNHFYADSEDFIVFDGFEQNGKKIHGKGRELLESMGGSIIEMPKLQGRTYALLDVYSLAFSDGMTSKDLNTADQLRVKQWLKKFVESLAGSVIALS